MVVLVMACFDSACTSPRHRTSDTNDLAPHVSTQHVTLDHGGLVRGDKSTRRIALIFTGGDHGDGTEHILATLRSRGLHASFFVTGDYLRKPEHHAGLERLVKEGHYLGPHSDRHLLYCPWEDRTQSLVSEDEFKEDLRQNLFDLEAFAGPAGGRAAYFVPPFEWYNDRHASWAREMGVTLVNFTPGTGSNRDYIPEGSPGFVPAAQIIRDILDFEAREPDGLRGFLLLLHMGSLREDKVYLLLGEMLDELRARGYQFVRVDQLFTPSR